LYSITSFEFEVIVCVNLASKESKFLISVDAFEKTTKNIKLANIL
jgi:hypothetical protein